MDVKSHGTHTLWRQRWLRSVLGRTVVCGASGSLASVGGGRCRRRSAGQSQVLLGFLAVLEIVVDLRALD